MYFSNYRFAVLIGGILALCAACQAPSSTRVPVAISLPKSTVKIESLRQPQRVERSISLTGSIIQQLAIVNGWLYQIDDGTGQIWVLTRQVAPGAGNQIHVKGVLHYEAIVISGADLGDYYLEEQERQVLPATNR